MRTRCDVCQHDWGPDLNESVVWLDEEGEETETLWVCDDCWYDEYVMVRRKLDIGKPERSKQEWKENVKRIREKRRKERESA